MINTQLQFESKIPMFQKFCIHKESHKTFKIEGHFDLEGQGHGQNFLE